MEALILAGVGSVVGQVVWRKVLEPLLDKKRQAEEVFVNPRQKKSSKELAEKHKEAA